MTYSIYPLVSQEEKRAITAATHSISPLLRNNALSTRYRLTIFNGLVLGVAYYGLELIGGNSTLARRLQAPVNTGIRMILKAPLFTPIAPMLTDCGIISLDAHAILARVRLTVKATTLKTPLRTLLLPSTIPFHSNPGFGPEDPARLSAQHQPIHPKHQSLHTRITTTSTTIPSTPTIAEIRHQRSKYALEPAAGNQRHACANFDCTLHTTTTTTTTTTTPASPSFSTTSSNSNPDSTGTSAIWDSMDIHTPIDNYQHSPRTTSQSSPSSPSSPSDFSIFSFSHFSPDTRFEPPISVAHQEIPRQAQDTVEENPTASRTTTTDTHTAAINSTPPRPIYRILVDSVAVDCNRVITAETEETEEIEQVAPASTSRSPWSILQRFHVSTPPAAEVDTTLASTIMDGDYPRPYNTAISDRERRRLARLDNSLGEDYSSIDREWLSMMGEPTYFIHKRSLKPHPRTVTFNQNVTAMPFFKANGVSHLLEIHPGDETDIEDGLRYMKYGHPHGVSSESHASLELKQLPAGAVDINSVAAPPDQHIHLEESAQSYSDEQQAQAVVGPVLNETPRGMSVAERVRIYEAKAVSSMTSVGHCIPTHIQTCRSVPTAAVILTEIPPVSQTVVTSAAAVKTPILSDTPAPVEKESPSGSTPKRTFLRMLSRGTWSRPGQSSVSAHSLQQGSSTIEPILNSGLEATASRRRNTKSVSNTGLDEPRDSTKTVDSGYNSNRPSIGSAFDATKLWLKTNMGKKSTATGTTLPSAAPLASVDIVSPEISSTDAQDVTL
ncbi:hypothetical protein BASA60_009548 [Batrachochytrium salamandrivorans]|nr:hypothetical protein BASA60_009548 [Batrachochytrium salamandrivorans]